MRTLLPFCLGLLLTLPILSTSAQPAAEPDLSLRVGGTAQVRASYAHEDLDARSRLGFGVRRLRLRLYAGVGSRFDVFVQGEGARADVSILDLRLTYRLSSRLQLRGGRMIMAQPAAFGLTLHYLIDALERSVIGGEWAKRTVGADGRDFGMEAIWTAPRWTARLALHNGDGDWDRVRGNFREDIGPGSATRETDRTGAAVSGALLIHPLDGAVEIGTFVGVNHARGAATAHAGYGRAYTTAALHAYWGARPGSQPVRLKADVIGIWYETLDAAATDEAAHAETVVGAAMLGAARVHRGAEVFVRTEVLDTNTTDDAPACMFVSTGISVSPSALRGGAFERERLTLAWTGRFTDSDRHHLDAYGLALQAQVVF